MREAQDSPSAVWTPRVSGHKQPGPDRDIPTRTPAERPATSRAGRPDPVKTPVKDAAVGPGGGRRGRDVGEHAQDRTAKHAAALAEAGGGVNGDHRGRRSQKRRGLGLKVAGGCVVIAAISLLCFVGNLAAAGGNGAPVGGAAAVSMPTPGSAGASSISSSATLAPSFTDSGFSEPVNPGSSAGSASPSAAPKPSRSTTSAPATRTTGPSAAPTSPPSSPGPTKSAVSPPPPPAPSPSPSPTHVSCFIFCW